MVIEKNSMGNAAAPAVLEEQIEPAAPTCRHHWVIEPANGPISWRECQICHEGKEFHNSIGDGDRDY